MKQVEPELAGRSPRRWLVAALVVASVSGATLLLSAGLASAAGPSGAPVPATQVLGLPVGTAVWALLGLAGLIFGLTTVRRSRRRPHREVYRAPGVAADPAMVAA